MNDDFDMSTYPKFQWSIFANGGKDQQYVVRAGTIDELIEGRDKVLAELKVEPKEQAVLPAQPTKVVITPPQPLLRCETCGAAATYREGVSKAGKPYKAVFCSTGIREHAKFL